MEKERFEKIWKVCLLIALIIGMYFMFSEWKNIDREAMACKNAPFVWGKQKASEQGITCTYSCSNDFMVDWKNRSGGIVP